MLRTTLPLLCAAALSVPALRAQQPSPTPASMQSAAAKIASAMSAAPASVSSHATIVDWPSTPGGTMPVLRQGTNGWTCLPDVPETPGSDPMCFDQAWSEWGAAYTSHAPAPPPASRVGIAYMLQGDSGASNVDPWAQAPTATNQWITAGPHLMVLVPDVHTLDGMSTDPASGGPWVMWKGTPYAHVMVPIPVTGH
jgi:hypothetical protein